MLNKLVLDPGHCAKWTGARGLVRGTLEHLVVLDVCLIMRDFLATQGITALLTHSTPQGLDPRTKILDLAARFDFAYSRKLPIFSLHCNSATNPKAYGYECYTLPGQDISDTLAVAVLTHYQQMFPTQHMRADYGDGDADKETNLAVLRQKRGGIILKNSGVLFELPFLSNAAEENWLSDKNNYPKIARSLGDGIIAWLKKINMEGATR